MYVDIHFLSCFLQQILCSVCGVFRVDASDLLQIVTKNEIQPITEEPRSHYQKTNHDLKGPSSHGADQVATGKRECASDVSINDKWNTNSHVCWRLLATVLDRIFFIQQIVLVTIVAVCLYPSLHVHRQF